MSVPDISPLLKSLDQLETMLTSDRSFVARALGLLLLGRSFTDDEETTVKDPTEILLGGGVEVPEP